MTKPNSINLLAVITAISIAFILFFVNNAQAATSVKIENSTGANNININSNTGNSDNSKSSTKIKNRIEINGKVYVNEESQASQNIDSDIEVKVTNNQGTIKYTSNGEEKIIQITPTGKVLGDKVKNKTTEKNQSDNIDKQNSTDKLTITKNKRKDLIQQMMEAMDRFINTLFNKFSN